MKINATGESELNDSPVLIRKEMVSLLINQNNFFYNLLMIPTIVIILFSRDKHGRPMSHPDYDPRTLLVKDLFSNNYYFKKMCTMEPDLNEKRSSPYKSLIFISQ